MAQCILYSSFAFALQNILDVQISLLITIYLIYFTLLFDWVTLIDLLYIALTQSTLMKFFIDL